MSLSHVSFVAKGLEILADRTVSLFLGRVVAYFDLLVKTVKVAHAVALFAGSLAWVIMSLRRAIYSGHQAASASHLV